MTEWSVAQNLFVLCFFIHPEKVKIFGPFINSDRESPFLHINVTFRKDAFRFHCLPVEGRNFYL